MVDLIRIQDYAQRCEVSERTVRNWINKDKIRSTQKRINNKNVKMVIYDEDAERMERECKIFPEVRNGSREDSEIMEPEIQNIPEAEIINESTSFQMVTIEQASFDNLIQSIKELADDRSRTDREHIKNLEEELHKNRAQVQELQAENKQLIQETSLQQAELNILKLRVEELEKKTKWFRKSLF